MSKSLYIIRHCQAEGQAAEAKLTEEGKGQAERLAEFLSGRQVDRIVSSPFSRAVETIKPFAEKQGLEIEVDSRLSERVLSSQNLPDWLEKLSATFEDEDLCFEGGESSKEAMARITAAAVEFLAGPGKSILLVTHGNIMALLLKHFDSSFGVKQWKGLTNPDVYLVKPESGGSLERLWKT